MNPTPLPHPSPAHPAAFAHRPPPPPLQPPHHRLRQRPVAVKVISPDLTSTPLAVERFRLEVRAAAQLSHPNIVTAHDAEQAGDLHYLVMEYVEGTSLARLVEKQGPLQVTH